MTVTHTVICNVGTYTKIYNSEQSLVLISIRVLRMMGQFRLLARQFLAIKFKYKRRICIALSKNIKIMFGKEL